MDRPLSNWGYGLAPFQLGIWTGPCFYFCLKKERNFDGSATIIQSCAWVV